MKQIKLERKTAATLITESLKQRIRNRDFGESEIIRQERLAEEYGVSLSPIREALIKLESEGLLTLVKHRGFKVTTLSIDDIKQLYELRAIIEVALLEQAIPRLQDSDRAEARQLHEAMRKVFELGTQTVEWTELNWRFHTILYAPAKKHQFMAVVENIYANIDRYIHMQLKIPESVDLARSVEEHRELLEYCDANEVGKASELLREHIMQACNHLIAFLGQRTEA